MASETWRVVLADGDIESVSAWRTDDGTMVRWDREIVHTHTTNVRRGVCMAIEGHDLAIVEILAPGELTRAELRAQAFREGAEAMREAVLFGPHHLMLSAYQEGRVSVIPVPPCPEVSR